MISYGFVKTLQLPFDTILDILEPELRKKGFEVLSHISVDHELRKHLGIEYKKYLILNVTNLTLAYKALLHEENFGLLIPCTIALYEKESLTVIAALRPTQFIPVTNNEYLNDGAALIERKLLEVLDRLEKIKPRASKKLQRIRLERALAII